MKVCVFGLGYVGCVSAACLADAGHEVIGVDIDRDKVNAINTGQSPIVEPGLSALIKRGLAAGRLKATVNAEAAIRDTELAMVCVGTPGHANGRLNVDALKRVCTDIGNALRGSRRQYTVVIRSTVLPGTIEQVLLPALRAGAGNTVSIAANPEFMREGTALKDFAEPPLTLVGCSDPVTARVLRQLYKKVDAEFVQTDIRTAEMAKYVSNAYHALKVCFANEIGNVCQALGADPQEVMRIFRLDRKLNVSEAYLKPGFAFGGSCLPKDVRALLYAARTADVPLPVLGGVLPSNERQVQQAIDRVLAAGRRKVGVIGLAFKPDTDDLRESPMVTLVEALIGKGCDVRILDPNVAVARLTGANRRHIEEGIPHIASLMCDDQKALLVHAEVLVVTSCSDEAVRVIAAADAECTVIDLTQGALDARLSREIHEEQPAWRFVPSAAAAVAAAPQPAR